MLLFFFCFSVLPVILSHAAIDKLQLADKAMTYEKLGIALVQHLSQNGVFIKNLTRKRHSGYRVFRYEKKSIEGLLKQTYVCEKFHLVDLAFFAFTSLYAFSKNLHSWALVITFTNLLYNVYPILLQQYIREKLALYQKKDETSMPAANNSFTKCRLKCMG